MFTTLPTPYIFHPLDLSEETYAKALRTTFTDPKFKSLIEKRNRLLSTADKLRPNSSELSNLTRTIQQYDRRLSDIIYAVLVQTYINSNVSYDHFSFNTILKYYVDYSKEGAQEKVDTLAANLDKITFLADFLESLCTDVKASMSDLFSDEIQFKQFDGVLHVLQQLRTFFGVVRSRDSDSPEAELYMTYADSINEYMNKRLKAYTAKYRKFHPAPHSYTAEDMVSALNQYFKTDKFGTWVIAHTPTGGSYIDAMKLLSNLDPLETERLDSLVGPFSKSNKSIDQYSFHLTDQIMSTFPL